MVAVGKTAWHHHLVSVQALSCQRCEYGLRRHVLWVPPGPLWTSVGVRGRADRGLLYHLNAGVGPEPRRASASSKSTLGGDTVLDRAARGL